MENWKYENKKSIQTDVIKLLQRFAWFTEKDKNGLTREVIREIKKRGISSSHIPGRDVNKAFYMPFQLRLKYSS